MRFMSSASSSKSYTEALETTRSSFDDFGSGEKLHNGNYEQIIPNEEHENSPLLEGPSNEYLSDILLVLFQAKLDRCKREH